MSGHAHSWDEIDADLAIGGEPAAVAGLKEQLIEAGMTAPSASMLLQYVNEMGMSIDEAISTGVAQWNVASREAAFVVAGRVRGILEAHGQAQVQEKMTPDPDAALRGQLRAAMSAAQGYPVSEESAEQALDAIRRPAILEGLSRPYFCGRVHKEIGRLGEVASSRHHGRRG